MLAPFLETTPLSVDLKHVSFAVQPSDRLLTNSSLERIVEELVFADQQDSLQEAHSKLNSPTLERIHPLRELGYQEGKWKFFLMKIFLLLTS